MAPTTAPGAWPGKRLSEAGDSSHHGASEDHLNSTRLALLCGRYEGVDERVRQHLITDEISIGDL